MYDCFQMTLLEVNKIIPEELQRSDVLLSRKLSLVLLRLLSWKVLCAWREVLNRVRVC